MKKKCNSIALTILLVLATLSIFSTPIYAAGSVKDENGNTYASLYQAVNPLSDGDSIVLTVTGEVPAGYTSGTNLTIRKKVNVTILSGSDDAKITGSISCTGGGKLQFGEPGKTNTIAMDGQISIESGDLEINPGLSMNHTTSGDACIYASSWAKENPVNIKIDGSKFTTSLCNHGIHLIGVGVHVDYIKNSEIINNSFRTDYSLYLQHGASIDEIDNVFVAGDRSAISITTGSEIGSINNSSIEASVGGLVVSTGSKIGSISDSKITNLDKYTDGSVTNDRTRYSAVRILSSADAETGIDTIKNCTFTSNGNYDPSGAIYIKGTSGHEDAYINTIEDCNLIVNNHGHGIYMTGDAAHIGTIKGSNIGAKYRGITLLDGSHIEDILKTEINLVKGESSIYGYGIDCKGSIGSISQGSKIKVSLPEAIGISISSGSIGKIDATEIDVKGETGAFGLSINKASLGTFSDSSMNVSGSGRVYGVNMQPGKIDYIKDSKINVEQKASGITFVAYQVGPIKEISGCNFSATGTYPMRLGWNVLNDPLFADDNYKPRLDIMKDTTITAGGYALGVQQDAELGILSGNHFYSTHSNYGAIWLSVGGVIEEIKSGTYASKGNAVYINYGSRPGPLGVYNSSLKKISYEEKKVNGQSIKEGPVFYGETGWAINANVNGPAPEIEVEKTQVELDQPLKGYARYYGGAAKIDGLGNGDAIIGCDTTDRSTDQDSYPIYNDANAEGTTADPSSYLYFMSKTGTDSNVQDDVLKDFAGLDISGKTFHYLTVNARLRYDPNDEKGSPKVDNPQAMDDERILDEYNSAHDVADNQYIRESYTFKGWNTKTDGSGTSYQPGTTLNITEANTILYAQWEGHEYTVTVSDDGNGTGSADPSKGSNGTEVSLTATPNEGYTFKEWQVISGGVTITDDKLTIGTENIEVKAIFEKLKYTVLFDSDGGTAVDSQTVNHGDKASEPNNPTKDDYIFKGWYLDDEEYDFDIPVTKDITLKARWEAVENTETDPEETPEPEPIVYTITYKLNGGTYNGRANDIVETYDENTWIKIHEAPTREGYKFLHWEGSSYQPNDDYQVTEDHTFTAKWELTPIPPTQKFTITYKLNGGTYNGTANNIVETYDENTWIKIHEAPTREGYKFLHWEGSSYQPNDDYQVTEDHTFTAMWEKAPSDKPIVPPTDTEYTSPQTGDNSKIILYGAMFISSLLFILALLLISRKYGKE